MIHFLVASNSSHPRPREVQMLVGDYNFVGRNQIASDGDVPAHHLSIAVRENILEEDCNGSVEFTDELTYCCMQMLKKATKKYNAFVNNFDAAHNTYVLVYAITAMIPPGNINGPPRIRIPASHPRFRLCFEDLLP